MTHRYEGAKVASLGEKTIENRGQNDMFCPWNPEANEDDHQGEPVTSCSGLFVDGTLLKLWPKSTLLYPDKTYTFTNVPPVLLGVPTLEAKISQTPVAHGQSSMLLQPSFLCGLHKGSSMVELMKPSKLMVGKQKIQMVFMGGCPLPWICGASGLIKDPPATFC